MDPSYASSDDEADAMAAAMGFSSFGTQGPSKKRKFNLQTDAFIEGQELAVVDKGGKKGQGSGGNQVPLGRTRVFGVSSETSVAVAENDEEIQLDDDEGPQYVDEEDDGPRYMDTSHPPPALGRIVENEDEILLDEDEEDQAPGYVHSSLLPRNEEALEAQAKIDAILAGAGPGKQKQKAKNPPSAGLGAFMSALKTPVVAPSVTGAAPGTSPTTGTTLPQRPIPPPPSNIGQAGGSLTNSQNSGHRGQRNELWYVGYYDVSFNENPWNNLEHANGLPEVGTWIERQQRGHGQRA